MIECRSCETPIESGQKFDLGDWVDTKYQKLVENFINLSRTCFDIVFAASLVSWFIHKPKESHCKPLTEFSDKLSLRRK